MNNLLEKSKLFWKRNDATVLTYGAAAGVVATTILAVKATPKAIRLLEQAEKEKGEELTVIEKVKVAGPTYIPTILTGIGTISCIFGLDSVHKTKQAGLMSAYTLIDQSFKEYINKVKEIYGEEVHNKIVNEIMVEKAEEEWYVTGGYMASSCNLESEETDGSPKIFYDEHSNRYFEATIERVMNAEYHLNRNYVLRGMAWLNEFYEFLGIESTDYGSVMGWYPEDESMNWIEFNHRKVIMENNGQEIYIIDMPFAPEYEPWNN